MMKIGVFGSALGNHTEQEMDFAFQLGKEIANKGCTLVTGATFGLPNQAVKGAHEHKGVTVGISPAYSKESHIAKYNMPIDDDIVIYTGLGYQGRNMINIRSCDAAIFLKGGIGTLNELTIAIKEEKIIGILENSGGVCKEIKSFLSKIDMNFYPKIIYSYHPIELVEKVVEVLQNEN